MTNLARLHIAAAIALWLAAPLAAGTYSPGTFDSPVGNFGDVHDYGGIGGGNPNGIKQDPTSGLRRPCAEYEYSGFVRSCKQKPKAPPPGKTRIITMGLCGDPGVTCGVSPIPPMPPHPEKPVPPLVPLPAAVWLLLGGLAGLFGLRRARG